MAGSADHGASVATLGRFLAVEPHVAPALQVVESGVRVVLSGWGAVGLVAAVACALVDIAAEWRQQTGGPRWARRW